MAKQDSENRPGLTIVGGQPKSGRRKRGTVKVPVGVEKLLYHATQNPTFRKELLQDRQGAITRSGVQLRPSEEAMLKAVPDAVLERMIDNIIPENPMRRKFMRVVAAAATSLAAGTAVAGCDEGEVEPDGGSLSNGIRPDMADAEPGGGGMDAGVLPDMPDAESPDGSEMDTGLPDGSQPDGSVDVIPEGGYGGDAGILPDTSLPDGNVEDADLVDAEQSDVGITRGISPY